MHSAIFIAAIQLAFVQLQCGNGFATAGSDSNSVWANAVGPVISNVTSCKEEDFAQGDQCTLGCNATTDHLYEWHWTYYGSDSLENVTIYEGVKRTDFHNLSLTQITLTLANYSAGYYRCWYHYVNDDSVNEFAFHDFKVNSTEKGIPLNHPCQNSTQCLSLDATCANATCRCIPPYVYPMESSEGIVACLKGVGSFQPCNIDEQCITAGDNYNCTDDICDCMAQFTYVGQVNRYLCLRPVSEGQPCSYQEECTLTDQYMWCYNGVCDCSDDYSFNVTLNQCINATHYPDVEPPAGEDGLSFGAVVGIIVGSAAAVAVLFALIGVAVFTLRSRF